MLARLVLAAGLSIMSLPALAHPESTVGSLVSGFAHPFLGVDHLLAMAAVGSWASMLGGQAPSIVPAAFVVGSIVGVALAIAGLSVPAVESGVAASVLVLGMLLATAVRLPLALSTLLVSAFAALHGHAHGAEVSGSAFTFSLGFTAATVLLLAAGMGLGQLIVGHRLLFARALGVVMAGIGLVLLGGVA